MNIMLEVNSLRFMRSELEKLATDGHGAPPQHQYEELNKARALQAMKDIPLSLLAGGIGYGVGRTGAEYLMPQVFQSPASQEMLKKNIGLAAAATTGLGTYFLSQHQRLMKKRRDEADKPKPDLSPSLPPGQQAEPANAPEAKLGGGIAPAVANATRKDPWRTDRRYPQFNG